MKKSKKKIYTQVRAKENVQQLAKYNITSGNIVPGLGHVSPFMSQNSSQVSGMRYDMDGVAKATVEYSARQQLL